MTPGQAFAALSASVGLAVALVSWWRGDLTTMRIALGFVACIGLMRLFKLALPPDLHLLAFAALWVAFGGAVVRIKPLAGAALVLSGLAYAGVAYTGAPTHYGVPLMVVSDIAGYVALAVLFAGSGGGKSVRRNSPVLMARDNRGRPVLARAGDCLCRAQARSR